MRTVQGDIVEILLWLDATGGRGEPPEPFKELTAAEQARILDGYRELVAAGRRPMELAEDLVAADRENQ